MIARPFRKTKLSRENNMKKQKTVAVSGGFDPLHIGHIRLFQEAKKLGDKLIVIVNNDNWLKKKKGFVFMHQKERTEVIDALGFVDEVIITGHKKNPKDMSVITELKRIRPDIFANGGDRVKENIPEAAFCDELNCQMIFNVGQGGKIQSSSWLLERYGQIIKSRTLKRSEIMKHLSRIAVVFKHSKIALPYDLKMKMVDFLLDLMKRRKNFGLFIILGWKKEWYKYTDISDSNQDIFTQHAININDIGSKKLKGHDIETTINFDGAILIDRNGLILHSGVMIEGLRPKLIAGEINPGKFKDLSDQFGFKRKVHTRHLSAITASSIFKNTTVVTISEEANDLHIFEEGRIIYSIP